MPRVLLLYTINLKWWLTFKSSPQMWPTQALSLSFFSSCLPLWCLYHHYLFHRNRNRFRWLTWDTYEETSMGSEGKHFQINLVGKIFRGSSQVSSALFRKCVHQPEHFLPYNSVWDGCGRFNFFWKNSVILWISFNK